MPKRQRAKEVTNEIYNGLQALSSIVGVLENERIGRNKSSVKSANHRANITDIVGNMDSEQFANRDEVFKVFEEMEVDFEEIMD